MMNSVFCDYPAPGNVVPFHNHHHLHNMQNNYSVQSQYSASSSTYLMPAPPLNNKGVKTQSSSGTCSTMGHYYSASSSSSNGYSAKPPPPPPPMPCSERERKTMNYSNGSSYPSTVSSNGYHSSTSTSYSSTPSVEQQQQKLQSDSSPPSPPSPSPPRRAPVVEDKPKQHITVTMDGKIQK